MFLIKKKKIKTFQVLFKYFPIRIDTISVDCAVEMPTADSTDIPEYMEWSLWSWWCHQTKYILTTLMRKYRK